MIGFAAGSYDVAAGAIVGVVGRKIIRAEGGYADDVVEGSGISGIRVAVIAGGEYGYAAVKDGIVSGRFEILDGGSFEGVGTAVAVAICLV